MAHTDKNQGLAIKKLVLPIFWWAILLMVLSTEFLYAQLNMTAANIIRGAINDRIVVLSWVRRSETADLYVLVRRRGKLRKNNIRRSDIVAQISTSLSQTADVLPRIGQYYYALIPIDVYNSDEPIEPSDYLHTSTPVVISDASAATMDSVIVNNIEAEMGEDSATLTYDVQDKAAELILYRSSTPIQSRNDLESAEEVQRFTNATNQITDTPPPDTPTYYSIQDAKLIDYGAGVPLRGVNTTIDPVLFQPPIAELETPEQSPPGETDSQTARSETGPSEEAIAEQIASELVDRRILNQAPSSPQATQALSEEAIAEQVIADLVDRRILNQAPSSPQATQALSEEAIAEQVIADLVDRGMLNQASSSPQATQGPSEEAIAEQVIADLVDRGMLNQAPPSPPVPALSEEAIAEQVIADLVERGMLNQAPSSPPVPAPSEEAIAEQVIADLIDRGMLNQAPSSPPVPSEEAITEQVIADLIDRGMLNQAPPSPPVPSEEALAEQVIADLIDRGMLNQAPPSPPVPALSEEALAEQVIADLIDRGMLNQAPPSPPVPALSEEALAEQVIADLIDRGMLNQAPSLSTGKELSDEAIAEQIIADLVTLGVLNKVSALPPEIEPDKEPADSPPLPTAEVPTEEAIAEQVIADLIDRGMLNQEPADQSAFQKQIIDETITELINRGMLESTLDVVEPKTVQESTQTLDEETIIAGIIEALRNPDGTLDKNLIPNLYSSEIPQILRSRPDIINRDNSRNPLPPFFVSEEDLRASSSVFKNELGRILREDFLQGDYAGTVNRLQTILLTLKPDELYIARAQFYLGQAYLGQNQFADALLAFLSAQHYSEIYTHNKRFINTLLQRYPHLLQQSFSVN